MKPSTENYDGDKTVPQGATPGSLKSWDPVIRCDAFSSEIRESGFDLAEIEWQARTAQSAWIAHNVRSYFADLMCRLRSTSSAEGATAGLKDLQNKAA